MEITRLGRLVRRERRSHGLRQAELAALAGVGTRFVSELENGKPGVELGRVVRVLECIGLVLDVHQKSWSAFSATDES